MPRSNRALPLIPFDRELERTVKAIRRGLRGERVQEQPHSTATIESPQSSTSSSSHEEFDQEVGEINNRSLRDYGAPMEYTPTSAIVAPTTQANDFEFKSAFIQLISNNQFGGSFHECPREHLRKILEFCSTVKHNEVTQDFIRLSMFKFSLRDEGSCWLMDLPPNSLTTWEEVTKAFLGQFYSLQKTAEMRAKIVTFNDKEEQSVKCEITCANAGNLR
ncbi:hypothetical protein BVRB_1g012900 [Beta vulgaris subsp. vulgaris]|nr:hypothetical protein BVRB_1g012900 [Beta vulgaris subsp. vulgaris]